MADLRRHRGPDGRGPHPLPLFMAMLQRHFDGEPERLAAALEGVRRYQQAPALPQQPPLAEVARMGGVRLLLAGGPEGAPPLVFVPSIINSPAVLDMAHGRSLVRHMAAEGHRTYLIDWGAMGPSERRLGMAGLVSSRLLPLVGRLPQPLRIAGYCLGGTLSIAAAQLLGERLERLALIATPWHFADFSAEARREAANTWKAAVGVGRALGAVPVTLINPLFWALDEQAVVSKFEALARRPADDPHLGWFGAVEDWASSGAPIPVAAARDLFERGFRADHMGRNRWRVRGQAIDPARIAAPIADFGALNDRIVPPGARVRLADIYRRDIPSGHVGMVVGSGAPTSLWQPLSDWLNGRPR